MLAAAAVQLDEVQKTQRVCAGLLSNIHLELLYKSVLTWPESRRVLYSCIDASSMALVPESIDNVAKILNMLPRVKVLKLNDNPFLSAIDMGVLATACPSLEYVVVHGTPLVSAEGYAAMESITNEQLKKLVLFQSDEEILDADWHVLVPDAERQKIVRETHARYFNGRLLCE